MEILVLILLSTTIFCFGIILNWYLQRRDERRKHVEKFLENFNKTGLVIIPLYQDNKKYNFVVDSGSTCNIIDEKTAKKLKINYFETNETTSSTIDGVTTNNKKIANITLERKKEFFIEDFLVFDMTEQFAVIKEECGEKIAGILGANFLSHYSKIIDFKNYIVA